MERKRVILGLAGLLVLLSLFILIYSQRKKDNPEPVSPNILYLTQPVVSFSGKVIKIDGNKLTVSQKLTASQNTFPPQPLDPGVKISPAPTPNSITATYEVLITENTGIYRQFIPVVYLFKTVTTQLAPGTQAKQTIKDIKIGQTVTVGASEDLRTLKGNMFEATTVSISPIANMLNGKITGIEGNTLIIKGFVQTSAPAIPVNSVPTAPQEKTYRISMTPDTEISRTSYQAPIKPGEVIHPPTNEKLSASDLKKDLQVTVYTAQDINESKELTALRIEPILSLAF